MPTIRAIAIVLALSLDTAHAASTVLLSATPNPAGLGAPLTLTATVSPSSATGRVTFYDGVSVLGTVNLAAGAAILNTAGLASGNRSLRAYYAGDSMNLPATSAIYHETVDARPGNGFQPFIATTVNASAIATGDFNEDGVPDMVAVDGHNSVSFLLGYGDGNFLPYLAYVSSGAALVPSSVAVGDLNGDGHADVVVPLLLGNQIMVFLGTGQGGFSGPVSYSTEGSPNSGADFVALGDFNGDGIVDIASAGHSSNSVTIFLGKGDGTFNPANNYPAGGQPVGLALGDFNGDGITDIATANNEGGDVTVMLGTGTGAFGAPTHISANSGGGGPYSIMAADFNGDGYTDLAVGTFDYIADVRAVVILLGHGDGTFSASPFMDTGGLSYIDVAGGDFNGDGVPDLASATGIGVLSLFLGSGTGSFQEHIFGTSDVAQQYIPALSVADFNGDGIADVAVAQGTAMVVYLGTPPVDVGISKSHTGVFQLGQTGAAFTISVSNSGSNATVGVVTVNDAPPSDFTVTAASGTGWNCTLAVQCVRSDPLSPGAHYPPITVTVTVSTSAAPNVTNVATVSAPGDTNASNNTASDAVVVLHSQTIIFGAISPISIDSPPFTLTATATSGLPVSYAASGNCTVSGSVVTPTGIGSCTITASQAGNAGYTPAPNVVQTFAILPGTSSISLLSSGSPSRFGAPITLTAAVQPAGATGRVTFYDGPTILGAQAVSAGAAAVTVRLFSTGRRLLTARYSGDAGHAPSASATISQTVQSLPSFGFTLVQASSPKTFSPGLDSAAVDDFNGDGLPDIVTGTFEVVNNANVAALAVYLNHGDGTFLAPVFTGTSPPYGIVTGDFNADGRTDVAMLGSPGIIVRFGNGNGSFGATMNYPESASSMSVADVNGDGYPDLVIGNFLTNSAGVLLNKGDGTFSAATEYTVQGAGTDLAFAIGDVDGDGKPDLVIGSVTTSANVIAFLQGNGDGTFGAPVYSAGGPNGTIVGVALGDLNGDGKLDVVIDQGTLSVSLGNGNGTFASPNNFKATNAGAAGGSYTQVGGDGTSGIVIVDVNGDGIPDIAATSSNLLQVFLGNGDGTLQSSFVYSYGTNSTSAFALTDFNGDGRIDLVSAIPQTFSVDIQQGGLGPLLSLSMSLNSNIYEDQINVPYTIVAGNAQDAAPTAGTVSVKDTIPQYGTLSSMNGPGWSCNVASATCTRSDSLSPGASYPPISVSMSIPFGTPSPLTNSALVFGGSAPPTMASVTAAVLPAPPNCPVSVNPGTIQLSPQAATGSFLVTVPAGCSWSLGVPVPSWVTFTSPIAATGSASVGYAIAANNGTAPRSTTLVVGNAGQSAYALVEISQAGVLPLQFFPMAPCRLVDTRGTAAGFNGIAPFSGPSIASGGTLTIPVQSALEASTNTAPAPCGVIPASAQAYSFNVTVLSAGGAVDYVSLWPAGSPQPFVATLNDPEALIVANAAIVPAGTGSGGVSVYNAGPATADVIIDMNGYFASPATSLQFYPISPCRLVDTRGVAAGFNGTGPFAGPSIAAGGTLTIPVQSTIEASADTTPAPCGVIPSTAQAYSFNLTVAPAAGGPVDYVSLWPAGSPQPFVSTLNDPEGLIVANAAIVPAGSASGGVSVFNAGPSATDVILDMNGYFAPPTTSLQFYPITPCRLVDTRGVAAGFNGIAPFSGPSIAAGGTLTIPVQSAAEAGANTAPAPCGVIPSTAQAYSVNLTVAPAAGGPVDYVSLWPADSPQPFVSTLNDPEGLIVANAAIVPAGSSSSGGVSVFNAGPSATDVIIDMNGYFAP